MSEPRPFGHPPFGVATSVNELQPGDVVVYPQSASDRRSQLLLTRVEADGVYGRRVHPEPWEREVEFVVIARQVAAGVRILSRGGPDA